MLTPADPQQQIIDTARSLFAAKGFYGASLNDIAKERGITKQAVLHHFGSKEKLYAAVLAEISASMMAATQDARTSQATPVEQLRAIMFEVYQHTLDYPDATKILMRELLDVERRANNVSTWYLKPFLQELTGVVCNITGDSEIDALGKVYPLMGIINYFAVSETVLSQIYGTRNFKALQKQTAKVFEQHTEIVINALVSE